MNIFTSKSHKFLISLDGTFDELRLSGTLESAGCFSSLSENEDIDKLWKSFGHPSCDFILSIFRAENLDGSTPSIEYNTVNGSLQISKNQIGNGWGNIKIHPKHFDNILQRLESKPTEVMLSIVVKGASMKKSSKDYFECGMQMDILQIAFKLN